MATNIGSLASAFDGHVIRFVIGPQGLRKNGESLAIFLRALPFHCRFPPQLADEEYCTLVHSLCSLSLTLFALLNQHPSPPFPWLLH
jgi:hypothetical protein